jgi:hypothetical protein
MSAKADSRPGTAPRASAVDNNSKPIPAVAFPHVVWGSQARSGSPTAYTRLRSRDEPGRSESQLRSRRFYHHHARRPSRASLEGSRDHGVAWGPDPRLRRMPCWLGAADPLNPTHPASSSSSSSSCWRQASPPTRNE